MGALTLQWHITNRCNKRCSHCYQQVYENKEFTTAELLDIGSGYLELLKEYNNVNEIEDRGHINITGGEPFIRDDIFELIEFFYKNRKEITFGILTNGSYLTEEVVAKLSKFKPRMVQVSLDGNKEMHDSIRGEGSFEEVIKAIKLLKKYNIKALVSFTANDKNYRNFSEVVSIARNAGAYKVWSDRLVPIGSGATGEVNTLSNKQVVEYINIMKKEKNKFVNKLSKTKVAIERSLQFLCGEGDCYTCSAGDGLIVVLEDGSVMPCRRLPLVVGNLKDLSLKEIYFNSDLMKDLRENKEISKGCEGCNLFSTCKGGAKCISYGIYGDYRKKDYGCPINISS